MELLNKSIDLFFKVIRRQFLILLRWLGCNVGFFLDTKAATLVNVLLFILVVSRWPTHKYIVSLDGCDGHCLSNLSPSGFVCGLSLYWETCLVFMPRETY